MQIKLLVDCPIRGKARKAGDVVTVVSENLGQDEIGLRCCEWLIENNKAEEVPEKAKKTAKSAD